MCRWRRDRVARLSRRPRCKGGVRAEIYRTQVTTRARLAARLGVARVRREACFAATPCEAHALPEHACFLPWACWGPSWRFTAPTQGLGSASWNRTVITLGTPHGSLGATFLGEH